MHFSSSDDGFATSRLTALTLAGLLLVSTVGGVAGSIGIAAAQSNGTTGGNITGGNSTAGNATIGSGAVAGDSSTANNPVQATVREFKQKNLGYSKLSPKKKRQVRSALQKLQRNQGNLSTKQQDKLINKAKRMVLYQGPLPVPMDRKPAKQKQVEDIISKHLGAEGGFSTTGSPNGSGVGLGIDIPGLMDKKLKSMANSFKKGAANVLTNVYKLAFNTPVPENNGWQGVFGTPTNEPFQELHQKLLVNKLYPVTNYLLSIGVMVLGISMVVNPLLSKFRILDLIIKFVTFLALYVFAWAAATLMHGVVNDITLWIRPSPAEMDSLVGNVGKMSAAAVGAYFVGSGGILATVFGLGVELGLRRVALQYFFPYLFPALLLIVYISPWQRLRSYANMAIWQYVNVLTMVIPMAILLKAAAIVNFSPGDGVVAMLVLIALFLLTVSIPVISTYFFIQVSGSVVGRVKSATAGAASRVGDSKDKGGGGSDDSGSDTTATAGTNPGGRTEDAVAASNQRSDVPKSGTLTSSTDTLNSSNSSDTTSAQVRALDRERERDPMSPSAMKSAYFDDSQRRTTTQSKLAD